MKKFCYVVCAIVFFLSCTQKDEIGSVVGDSFPEAEEVDSFSVLSYSFAPDSFNSSGWDTVTIGAYADPVFGDVYAAFIGKVALPSNTYKIAEDSSLVHIDSMALEFKVRSYYGHRTQTEGFWVCRLDTNNANFEDTTDFYNNSSFSIGDTIGYGRMHGDSALGKGILHFKLNESFVSNFSKLIVGADVHIENQEILDQLLRGLAILPDTSNGFGIGAAIIAPFDNASGMVLYYSEVQGDSMVASEDIFKFSRQLASYSKYETSESASLDFYYDELDTLKGSEELFIQGFFKNSVLLKFPHISSLEKSSIQLAELKIPVQPSVDGDTYLPPNQLFINNVDFGSGVMSSDFTLLEWREEDNEEYYWANVTEHVYRIMDGTLDPSIGFNIFTNVEVPHRVVLKGNENIKLNLVFRELK